MARVSCSYFYLSLNNLTHSLPSPQVEPGFLLGFLESSIASLERSTDEDVNGIISRVELIERLRIKRTQASVSAKILESDSDNGAFDNEKHYAGTGRRRDNDDDDDEDVDGGHHHHNEKAHGIDDGDALRKQTPATSKVASPPPPPTKQFVPESPSMPHIDDSAGVSANTSAVTTPTGCPPVGSVLATSSSAAAITSASAAVNATAAVAYDNSIASEPSEATTTCSDDATVISQLVEVIKELETDRPEVRAMEQR